MSPRRPVGVSRVATPKHLSKLLRRAALFITLIAFSIVSVGILAFREADRLMRVPPTPLQTVVSNIMPPYSLASFISLDNQTELSGWIFPSKGKARSTIILVHDQMKNRLQFGLDTPYLYDELTNLGFNVLSFDLRHSGQSGGPLSGYGYAEWEDVIAAIGYARKNTATHNVVLYGFGSGCTAVLLALDHLPEPDAVQKSLPVRLRELGFDSTYVAGVMLDSPSASGDSYVRAEYRSGNLIDRDLMQYAVPYAVRMSAGSGNRTQLTTVLTRLQLPAFISYSKSDTRIGYASIEPLVHEQLRLHPDTTLVHEMDKPGSVEGFLLDRTAYMEKMKDYFRRFFD